MKTKLKFFFDALTPKAGRANLRQREFTFRKFFAVCLLVMVAQVGLAEPDWNSAHDEVTFYFTSYSNGFAPTEGSEYKKVNGVVVNLMSDPGIDKLGGFFAAQGVTNWKSLHNTFESKLGLTNTNSGRRYLSVLKLYAGDQVTITYDKASNISGHPEQHNIPAYFATSGQVSGKNAGDELVSGTTYTMAQDGELDIDFPRQGVLKTVVIKYNSRHLSFTDASGYSSVGSENGMSKYRYRLSSRRFDEPTPSVFPTYSGGTLTYQYKIVNYGSSVGQKTVAVDPNYSTNGDILFNNLGWCQVTVIAKDGDTEVARGSYLVEVWDNEAYYVIDYNSEGAPYKYRFAKDPKITNDNEQGGVLKSRTVTAIPGMVMKFSIPENSATEPNTTVVYKYTTGGADHMVSFTNNISGWWDREPYNNYTSPEGGTFYSFNATASGKLKFGGVKPFQSGDNQAADYKSNAGSVYLVKKVYNETSGQYDYIKTWVFDADESGYLSTEGRTQNDENNNTSLNNGEISVEAGITYFLQGEANRDGDKWTPFLLEWFSFETDLKLSQTYGVSDKTGSEISSSGLSITSRAVVTINGNPATSANISTEFKGNINGATVALDNSGHLTFSEISFDDANNEGGVIKVNLENGGSHKEFYMTIPYGKHVWDFRNIGFQGSKVDNGSYTSGDDVDDPSTTDKEPIGLVTMMKNNGTDWSRVFKVHSKVGGSFTGLITPIMAARGTINGNNAFYMDNTAGLVFVTGAESFGAEEESNNKIGYNELTQDQKYEQPYTIITGTRNLWLKGNTDIGRTHINNSTIYFPGVKKNQYIKVYGYRHSDDKGENFIARNLVDLDGKSYNSTGVSANSAEDIYFKLRGVPNNQHQGDNMKGEAIFRVPNTYTPTDDFADIPSLSLCDDGWATIYKIEILDEYESGMIMVKDDGTTGDLLEANNPVGHVAFDTKYGSVVLKKHGNSVASVTNYYNGRADWVNCQNANSPRYQVIADGSVSVTPTMIVWQSGGGVNYNRLKLQFNSGNGYVRIIQREVVNEGNGGWYDGLLVGDAGNTRIDATDFVINKNEYRIAVGEINVQSYPYTWDFTLYNLNNNHRGTEGASSTVEAIVAANSLTDYGKWNTSAPPYKLSSFATKSLGTTALTSGQADPTPDPQHNSTYKMAAFAQGSELKTGTTTIIEGEGLGISLPSENKTASNNGTSLECDGYKTSGNIEMNAVGVKGAGSITIPEVGKDFYIFVKSTTAPTSVTGASVATDIFNTQDDVYLYQQTANDPTDVVINFPESADIEIVAVTDITKGLDRLGYATESRDHSIDHNYEGKLTTNDVNAYIIKADTYDKTYNYKGYPTVKKIQVHTTNGATANNVVPANTGVVLCKGSSGTCTSPLFFPAVNNVPSYEEANNSFWKDNRMIPNVRSKLHDSEQTSMSDEALKEVSITSLPYYVNGEIGDPEPHFDKSVTTIYGRETTTPGKYVDLNGYKELLITQTAGETVRCFFYNASGKEDVTIYPVSGKVNLKNIYDTYGQVKLISIKASAYNTVATVTDVRAIPYDNSPSDAPCTKFVMGPSYYTYYKNTESMSGLTDALTESFYRMKLDTNPETATTNNTLGANKALLLIPSANLPTALWNGGSGARQGVIYLDLPDFEDEESTNISNPLANTLSEDANQDIYHTLSGSKLNGKPTVKGIYICNGKKVTVK